MHFHSHSFNLICLFVQTRQQVSLAKHLFETFSEVRTHEKVRVTDYRVKPYRRATQQYEGHRRRVCQDVFVVHRRVKIYRQRDPIRCMDQETCQTTDDERDDDFTEIAITDTTDDDADTAETFPPFFAMLVQGTKDTAIANDVDQQAHGEDEKECT